VSAFGAKRTMPPLRRGADKTSPHSHMIAPSASVTAEAAPPQACLPAVRFATPEDDQFVEDLRGPSGPAALPAPPSGGRFPLGRRSSAWQAITAVQLHRLRCGTGSVFRHRRQRRSCPGAASLEVAEMAKWVRTRSDCAVPALAPPVCRTKVPRPAVRPAPRRSIRAHRVC